MSYLRSELQICSDLRLLTFEQLEAHLGIASPLIHTVKEMGSLLIDQRINSDTLLIRRFTIHGAEVGFRPNEIFTSFMPFNSAFAKYAENFGLFAVRKKSNRTLVIPLLKSPPSISNLVADPEAFRDEARALGPLGFAQKNVLATHRNLKMTEEAHKTVSRLFLKYSRRLAHAFTHGQRIKHEVVNRMNECADEIWTKSSYYPRQATVVKEELMRSDNPAKRFLGRQIEPHESFTEWSEPISNVVMRGSHLVRSLLLRARLYEQASTPVCDEQREFLKSCGNADLDPPSPGQIDDVKKLLPFLDNIILSRIIWWGGSHGKDDNRC